MAPILLGPLLLSVNLYAATTRGPAKKPEKSPSAESKECQGDIVLKGVCDPICDAIFSGAPDPKKQAELAAKYFAGTCDSICECICDEICDAIL